jgi:hypothetical protein
MMGWAQVSPVAFKDDVGKFAPEGADDLGHARRVVNARDEEDVRWRNPTLGWSRSRC